MHCVFSGSIELDELRLMQSMIQKVQCSSCSSVRKAKVKGQEVLITPHKPRMMRAVRNVTRWMEQETEWVRVQKKE